MATLTTLIAAALVRLGLQVSKDRGWYPSSYYVKSALDALRADQVDRAIAELGKAWREEPSEEAQVAREVILMRLDAEDDRLAGRESAARKLRDVATGEITVLELRLRRLTFAYAPRLAWIAAGAGAAVVAAAVLAATRLSLAPAAAAVAVAVFAAAALALLALDRRHQQAAFAAHRAAMSDEVAAEIEILRAEIEKRDAEITALATERRRIAEHVRALPRAIAQD
jgi:hypothetical protein